MKRLLTHLLCVVFLLSTYFYGQSLPEAPTPQTSNKSFYVLAGVAYGSALSDAYVSSTGISNHQYCFESNSWIYGKKPSAGRYYGQMMVMTTGTVVLSYWLRKKHWARKMWMAPMLFDAGSHAYGTVSTIQNCK